MHERAIVVTEVIDVSTGICDHGCRQAVRMTNLLNDSSWVMCIASFERHLGHSLQMLDCSARHGKEGHCLSCPYGF